MGGGISTKEKAHTAAPWLGMRSATGPQKAVQMKKGTNRAEFAR